MYWPYGLAFAFAVFGGNVLDTLADTAHRYKAGGTLLENAIDLSAWRGLVKLNRLPAVHSTFKT